LTEIRPAGRGDGGGDVGPEAAVADDAGARRLLDAVELGVVVAGAVGDIGAVDGERSEGGARLHADAEGYLVWSSTNGDD
jgi:hypothetical protein